MSYSLIKSLLLRELSKQKYLVDYINKRFANFCMGTIKTEHLHSKSVEDEKRFELPWHQKYENDEKLYIRDPLSVKIFSLPLNHPK